MEIIYINEKKQRITLALLEESNLPKKEYRTKLLIEKSLGYRNDFIIFEYDNKINIYKYKDERKTDIDEYVMDQKAFEATAKLDMKHSYTGELIEIECKKYKKVTFIAQIDINDIEFFSIAMIQKRIHRISMQKLQEQLELIVENSKENIENSMQYYSDFEKKIFHPYNQDIIYLKNGLFDLRQMKTIENGLIKIDNVIITEKELFVITDEEKMISKEKSDDLFIRSNDGEELEYRYVDSSFLVYRILDEDNYLGYSPSNNGISLYKRSTEYPNEFSRNYEEITIEENEESLTVYGEEYGEIKELFKQYKSSDRVLININGETLEFESQIKDKIINNWNSINFDFILLENGDLYSIQKEDRLILEIIETNCTQLDLVVDWNRELTVLKTNNSLHYYPRFTYSGELSKNHIKQTLTEELQDNNLIPIYVEYKNVKTKKIHSYSYLTSEIVIHENKAKLELSKGKKKEALCADQKIEELDKNWKYILYDYKEKVIHLDGKLIELSQRDKESHNYDGDHYLMNICTNKFDGYEKIVIKEDTNYLLFKGLKKKKIGIFLFNKERGIYEEETLIGFYREDSDKFGAGFGLFNDAKLPNAIKVEKINYEEALSFTYLQQKEIITYYEKGYKSPKIEKI